MQNFKEYFHLLEAINDDEIFNGLQQFARREPRKAEIIQQAIQGDNGEAIVDAIQKATNHLQSPANPDEVIAAWNLVYYQLAQNNQINSSDARTSVRTRQPMTAGNATNLVNTFIRQNGLNNTEGMVQQLGRVDPSQAAELEKMLELQANGKGQYGLPIINSLMEAPQNMVSFYKRRTGRWYWVKPIKQR